MKMNKAIKPLSPSVIKKLREKAKWTGRMAVIVSTVSSSDEASLSEAGIGGLRMNLLENIEQIRPGGRVEALVDGVLGRMTMLTTSTVLRTEREVEFLNAVVAARRDYPKEFLAGVVADVRESMDVLELDHY